MHAAIVSMTTVKTKAEIWSVFDAFSLTLQWLPHIFPTDFCLLNQSIVVDTSGHCWTDRFSTIFPSGHIYRQASKTLYTLHILSHAKTSYLNEQWLGKYELILSIIHQTCKDTNQQLQTFCSEVHICFPLAMGFSTFAVLNELMKRH